MIVNKLFLDNNYTKNPNGSLTKARNVVFDDNFVNYTNEKGFTKIHTFEHNICGIIPTTTELVVFTTNNNGLDRIYRVANNIPTLSLQGNLSFNTDSPVKGEYQYNNHNDLIIAFNDRRNPYRLFNFDNPYMEIDNITKEFVNSTIGLNLLKATPNYKMPSIFNFQFVGQDTTSGSMPKGAYQVVISYYINDYDRLNWSIPSEMFYCHKVRNERMYYSASEIDKASVWHTTATGSYILFNENNQDSSEELTDNTLPILIGNLDTSFSKYKLALIHRTATSVKVYDLGDYTTDVATHYIRELPNTELSLDEVTIPTVSYHHFEDITVSLNRLVGLGATANNVIDYQKYANNIKVTYNKYEKPRIEPFGDYRVDAKSLAYDEVYALNIGLVGKDGTVKGIFHIPGRSAKVIGGISESNSDFIRNNTAARYDDADRYLSYWENKDETYPNNQAFEIWDVDSNGFGHSIGTLVGSKVRHHKMPDFSKLYDVASTGTTAITPAHISLDFTNIKFPSEIINEIQGFFIAFSNRDSSNTTVLGYQPLIRDDFYKPFTPPYVPVDIMKDATENYRFNDFNLLTNKPAISNPYLTPIYKGTNVSDINSTVGELLAGKSMIPLSTNSNIEVDDYKYLPRDNSATIPDNKGREDTLMLTANFDRNGNYSYLNDTDNFTIYALKSYKSNLYVPFYNRRVSIASGTALITPGTYVYSALDIRQFDSYVTFNTSILYRGDQSLIIDEYTKTIKRENGDDDDSSATAVNSFTYLTVSTVNTDVKNHKSTNVDESYKDDRSGIANFFGASDYSFEFNSNFNVDPSKDDGYSYDNHYSFTNSIVPYYTSDYKNVFIAIHPHRVARSAIQSKESLSLNWRYFSALEYYEMPKHRGNGVSITGQANMLLIHMEHSLYIAQSKDKISTPSGDAYIGSSDIFNRLPEELIPTTRGTAGIQSRFGSAISDFGYTFVDTYDNTVYNYSNNSFDAISDDSARWLMNKYMVNSNFNPLVGKDFIIGVDHANKRLIMTNITDNTATSFTLSYSYAKGKTGWISYHDYIPALIVNNRVGSYSVNRDNLKELYEFNTGAYGTYYNGRKESYIDVLINDKPNTDKSLSSVLLKSGVNDDANNIAKLFIYNRNKCSNIITLEEFTSMLDYDKIRYLDGGWQYGFIRDNSSNDIVQDIIDDFGNIHMNSIVPREWYELGDITGRYFIVRLILDNTREAIFRDLEYNITLNRR